MNGLFFYGCSDKAKPVRFSVVTDSAQWVTGDEAVYRVITGSNWSTYYPTPPAGADFANHIYLVASRGQKPNPGYQIRIVAVEQLRDRVTVKLELKDPEPGRFYPQVIVRPAAVAQIARADLVPSDSLEFIFVDQGGQQLTLVKVKI